MTSGTISLHLPRLDARSWRLHLPSTCAPPNCGRAPRNAKHFIQASMARRLALTRDPGTCTSPVRPRTATSFAARSTEMPAHSRPESASSRSIEPFSPMPAAGRQQWLLRDGRSQIPAAQQVGAEPPAASS